MFEFFKRKFEKTKSEHQILQDLPEVIKGKLIHNYSKVSKLDNNCELLTTFYDYIKLYDQNKPINWKWECHQSIHLDNQTTEQIDYFKKTFTSDCVLDVKTGIVDCKKVVEISNIDSKLIGFELTPRSLLTPPTDSSISPDFLNII